MNEQWYLWFIKSMNMGCGFNKETLGLNMSQHCCNHQFLIACSMQKRRPTSVANQKQLCFGYVQWILLYRSAINLCGYKIKQIGQFWRLLNFMRFLIMQFYCQKDSSYMTWNLWKEQDEEKKWLTYFRPHTTHYRGINLLVALNDALLNPFFCFDYSF